MAHWISSKLKAAETLLQQIDEQAAESLRKGGDKPQSDDQLGNETSPRIPETKPLIKDQLKKKKKKAPENVISTSKSDFGRDDESRASTGINRNSNVDIGLTDSDWTELLSGGNVSRRSNEGLGIRGKKIGSSSGSRLNLNGRSGSNEVTKGLQKSSAGLESNANADSDERSRNADDVTTPRTSNLQSPSSSEGDLDRKKGSSTLMVDDANDATSIGRSEAVNDIVNVEKLHSMDDPNRTSRMMSTSRERMGMTGGDGGKSGRNGSKLGSRISSSTKKVASVPSDGESNSETDTTSSSDSESEREKEERRKRRQQILAEKAAAKAIESIKDRENLVARLEGEKQSLEKILEERAKEQVQEASELQTTMMETMDAVEIEKQKHNNTRMEALARLAKLESANADLARSLAAVQKNLEVEVDRVAELREQIHIKQATLEELRRKISNTCQNGGKLLAPKGVEIELEILEAEYSFVTDKVGRMQEKANTLETSIETTRRDIENPTEVEIELKRRLGQLTDHLIQKQAQVEMLSSEKATLQFRIEAVSRTLEENSAMADFPSTSSRNELLQSGVWQLSNTKLRPLLKERMQSGRQHLGSLIRQMDSLYCAGAVFLRRNSTARIWSVVYLVCLHLWVVYILMSHSPVADDTRSGAVISLENINNTGAV